jgi:SAM-dependent methyltransferase
MLTMDRLKEVITEGRSIELLDEGIYTVLGNTSRYHQYDQKAAIYDFLVSSRLYNRIIWGTSPDSHMAFAAQAVKSDQRGPLLDAGCGSLVFTARAHLEAGRLVIACDQSLDMLRRARSRLMKLSGRSSEQIILLQADLSDLPFRAASFQTILCMNVLHHYADGASLIRGLNAALVEGGQLYLTTLVKNNRSVGDRYLNLLHKQGWIVRPRNEVELKRLVEEALSINPSYKLEGNMAYVTTAVS